MENVTTKCRKTLEGRNMKLIMTKGLPASGKTTWAKTQNAYRINKDDLRLMINNGIWSKANEKYILLARDALIALYLRDGNKVIVDDTNLAPKHEETLKQLAKECKADFEVQDFTDVPLEECIKRDQKRSNYVGEKVIKQMYKQFLAPKISLPIYNAALPRAIICDLDGTLCLFGDKNPYDRDFENDKINESVRYILDGNDQFNEIIFVSGRNDK
jgi:predicted kinase